MKTIVVFLAILLIALNCVTLYQNIQQFKQVKDNLAQESNYVNDINMITQKNQEYYATVLSVTNNFYNDDRLYLLWKNFEKKFGSSFVSLSVAPTYTEENGLKWFDMSLSVNTDPISFINIIKTVTPPLFIESFSYNKQQSSLTAGVKGAIISDKKGFVITEDMEKGGSYVVCKYIMSTPDSNLVLNGSNYFVVKKDDLYYVGTILESGLDLLSAEGDANRYAQQGIITFIAKEGGK